ncbi:glycosyltransferase [Arthrobacter sp. SD76]|uniref:glycosyltransferase n=1 Tax=Arthrobacter sp. SD76 TaxID=3415007 RepID=UPI003C71D023
MIHVTESYGGGVASAIRDYGRNYPRAEHHLIYAPREDAPVDQSLMAGFAQVIKMDGGHLTRVACIRRHAKQFPKAIIHAHSSFGGLYARLAVRKTDRRPIIYTPHCYGFERRDVGLFRRSTFWVAEWLLAFNTTIFAACSRREQSLSKWPLSSSRSIFLTNVPTGDIGKSASVRDKSSALRVVGAGRLGPQKDPQFFRDCVDALRLGGFAIDPLWIGGGDAEKEALLQEAGIPTTGWLSRSDTLKNLAQADVYIHTARWEGFPIAVLEAALTGLAIVVRDIPAFEGVDMPLRISSPSDLLDFWQKLDIPEYRDQVAMAVNEALADCNDKQQRQTLEELYALAN